ncbi:MAG: hypothetical protein V4499_07495 [Pseudomonadota bacterium]|jgi:hypothetical protein
MNVFEFVIAIVIVTGVFSLLRHRMGIRDDHGVSVEPGEKSHENERLRNQVQQLQERIRVLERIVTDRGVETAAQIEALRDRDTIENGDKLQ